MYCVEVLSYVVRLSSNEIQFVVLVVNQASADPGI